jgi:hypothetical protein
MTPQCHEAQLSMQPKKRVARCGVCTNLPSQLRVGHKVVPRSPHIGKQRLDLLVYDAVGNLFYRLTNLLSLNRIVDPSITSKRKLTMSFPRPMVNVMPCPTRFESVYSDTYAEE